MSWKSLGHRLILLSKENGNLKINLRRNASNINPEYTVEHSVKIAYTSLSPGDQNSDHIGMWYTLHPDLVNRLFTHEGLKRKHKELNKDIFVETSFMVREPALTMIDYIHRSNLKCAPNKFIFYGRNDTGKTVSLAHVIHYLAEENFMLVHIAVPARWLSLFKEIIPSNTENGFFDHTIDASLWLQQFRQQNEPLLQDLALITTESYQWTQRETTEKGSSLLSLVDFGISRARYSCLCIHHLVKELKIHAKEGRIKLAYVVDGMNAMYTSHSFFLREDRTPVGTEHFTLFRAFAQFMQNDWEGGVIVGSVDSIMSPKNRRESNLPRYLLGRKGWADLDPFVPIKVNEYSHKELESAIDYFVSKKWLQHPAGHTPEGREELAFMSGLNPGELLKLVNVH